MASVILAGVLVVAFTLAGYAKISAQPAMQRAANQLGLSLESYRAIGAVELLGAFGVMIGVLDLFRTVGFLSAGGLFALMVGAIGFHFQAEDEASELAPAAVMALLTLGYLTAIGLR
ncbi:MAG: DoxX family protein [Actinomycetota bacterium]